MRCIEGRRQSLRRILCGEAPQQVRPCPVAPLVERLYESRTLLLIFAPCSLYQGVRRRLRGLPALGPSLQVTRHGRTRPQAMPVRVAHRAPHERVRVVVELSGQLFALLASPLLLSALWPFCQEIQKYRNTFAIKLLHKAYNQHQGAHPTPAHAQCRTAHRLSAGVR